MPQRNTTSKNPPAQKHQIDISRGKLGMDASPYITSRHTLIIQNYVASKVHLKGLKQP